MRRLLALALVLAALPPARAHEAPSGFVYPPGCCNNNDCHPVSCSALREVEGGIEFLGVKFTGEQIKRSEDGFCHVCIGYYSPTNHTPHCVFMTPRT